MRAGDGLAAATVAGGLARASAGAATRLAEAHAGALSAQNAQLRSNPGRPSQFQHLSDFSSEHLSGRIEQENARRILEGLTLPTASGPAGAPLPQASRPVVMFPATTSYQAVRASRPGFEARTVTWQQQRGMGWV